MSSSCLLFPSLCHAPFTSPQSEKDIQTVKESSVPNTMLQNSEWAQSIWREWATYRLEQPLSAENYGLGLDRDITKMSRGQKCISLVGRKTPLTCAGQQITPSQGGRFWAENGNLRKLEWTYCHATVFAHFNFGTFRLPLPVASL